MVIGDTEYNRMFRDCVTIGLASGLSHPVEWLVDYGRTLAMPYDQIPSIDEFLDLAWGEFFGLFYGREPKNNSEIQMWIDIYYNKSTKEVV